MDSQVLWVILAAAGWGLAYLAARKTWGYRRQIRSFERGADKLSAENDQLIEDLAHERSRTQSFSALIDELKADRDRASKLAQERFELIEGVLGEKQGIWRMYRDSTRQAGVAQDWLLREYSAALQLLNAYRRKAGEPEIKAPSQLAALLAEFGATAAAPPEEAPTKATVQENAPT